VVLSATALVMVSLHGADLRRAGFDPRGIVIATFEPRLAGYSDDRARLFFAELERRAQSTPTVVSAAVAGFIPLGNKGDTLPLRIAGHNWDMAAPAESVAYNYVGPRYLRTLGIGVISGREFTDQDDEGTPLVVMVSRELANRWWSGREPLGQRIRIGDEKRDRTVIGVAADIKLQSLGETAQPLLYVPVRQYPHPELTLHVRVNGSQDTAMAAVRRLVESVDANMPIVQLQTMDDAMAFSLVPARIAIRVLASSGAVTLLLTLGGVYGVLAYVAAQRRRDLAVRAALGASPSALVRFVLRDAVRLTAIGLGVGLPFVLASVRAIRFLLFGLGNLTPLAISGVAVMLAAVAVAAGYLPARRVLRADPMPVLRSE
jgi:putative ABC transport system permease protein